MNLKTSAEVINDISSKWRKNSNYKYSQNICFCQNAIQNLPPFIVSFPYSAEEAQKVKPSPLHFLRALVVCNGAFKKEVQH